MRALAAFLRTHQHQIVERWRAEAARLPSARRLPPDEQRDHVPEMLAALANAVDRDDPTSVSIGDLPTLHSEERCGHDYDLVEIVAEYRMLRRAILDQYLSSSGEPPRSSDQPHPLAIVNENIDRAIAEAVEFYERKKQETRDQFVGILAHDLRTPLQTIALNAEMLLRHAGVDERQQRMATRIGASADRMERMIHDLLDFARTRLGGSIPVEPVTIDLDAMLRELVDDTATAHRSRDITLQCEAPPASFRLVADPDRIRQALTNLVDNAIKHGTDPVIVALHDEGEQIIVSVSNRGEIPEQFRPHLFELLQSGDPRLGTGLGLYIVKQIARAHGGRIRLLEGVGTTTFRLSLPKRGPCV